MKSLTRQFIHSPMGLKLTLSIIVFSLLITLLAAGLQLMSDYKSDVNRIDWQLKNIEKVNLDVLAASLWVIDERLINLQLNALIQLPDISYISINDDGGQRWAAGEKLPTDTIEKSFILTYNAGKDRVPVGVLHVQADLKNIHNNLQNHAMIALLYNAIKVSILIGFILFLAWLMVTKNLQNIIRYCKKIDLNDGNKQQE
ncbi:hypothetical protein HQQ94_20595 [Shewanella sp. VB17]|uniref:hypothetical protein n=1 Tax=Shewanella sp. VB17 TaxID=2739432 RepID=UPI00156742F7|nr:hypothetical protein [Shewanella sp. VB17]NRD75573.1 hypothetical protein [Shewanella sp. VB17]